MDDVPTSPLLVTELLNVFKLGDGADACDDAGDDADVGDDAGADAGDDADMDAGEDCNKLADAEQPEGAMMLSAHSEDEKHIRRSSMGRAGADADTEYDPDSPSNEPRHALECSAKEERKKLRHKRKRPDDDNNSD